MNPMKERFTPWRIFATPVTRKVLEESVISLDASTGNLQQQGSLRDRTSPPRIVNIWKPAPATNTSYSANGYRSSGIKLRSPCSNLTYAIQGGIRERCSYCCMATEETPNNPVSTIFIADEEVYIALGDRGIAVLPIASSFCEYHLFASDKGFIRSFLVHGERVISAYQDNKIRVWRRHYAKHIHFKKVATLPVAGRRLISCFGERQHVQLGRRHKVLQIKHLDVISALALGKDGLLYSGSWDKTVKVWKLSNFDCIESFQAHDDAVSALLVRNLDGALITGSADSTIKIWVRRARTRKHVLIIALKGHPSPVNALALCTTGSYLYSGGSDGSIKVWKTTDELKTYMEHKGSLAGHRRAVLCLATQGGQVLFSGSADKTIRLWKRDSACIYSCIAVLEGHSGPVSCLAASTISACVVIYSGSLDCSVKTWIVRVDDDQEDDYCRPETNEKYQNRAGLIRSL